MNAVIVVAGGSGKRMGGPIPKQYMELSGKPMVVHTLERFIAFDGEMLLVLVMARDHRAYWDTLARPYIPDREVTVVTGGETRFDSVKNGLQQIGHGCIVGIHDAVRPLVSRDTIERCYLSAESTGSGIPVLDVDESIRQVQPGGSVPVDRKSLKRVQTPQVFKSELIKEAYRQINDPTYTDDATVYESVFGNVSLVEGNPENIKITRPSDLDLASLII
jgi:2-C-methyl-D-erythritol 4-phosphate cytidylyltransferase